jgi:hypothetical protein
MKRFSKILTLILVLIAILTAFTVVALADGNETGSTKVDTGDSILLTDFGGTVTSGQGALTNSYAVFGNQAIYYDKFTTSGGYSFTPSEPIVLGEYTKLNLLVYNPEKTSTGLASIVNYTGDAGSTLRVSQGGIAVYFEPGWQLITGTIKTSRIGTTLQSINFSVTGYDLTGTAYPMNHGTTASHHGGDASCECAGTIEGHCKCSGGQYGHSNKLSQKKLYVAGIWLTKTAATSSELISTPVISNGQTDVQINNLSYRINFSSNVVASSLDNAITVFNGENQITEIVILPDDIVVAEQLALELADVGAQSGTAGETDHQRQGNDAEKQLLFVHSQVPF